MNIVIAIIVLLAYTIALCIKGGGIPPSLSASVFDMKQSVQWIWTAVLAAVCFMCVPTYIEKTGENTQFLAFISIAALVFVGGAPLVEDTKDIAYKVHCVAALVCAACSQLVLVFNQPWLLLCWFPWAVAEFIETDIFEKRWITQVFWAEMVCFANTFSYCII
jgi:hypothetical protein